MRICLWKIGFLKLKCISFKVNDLIVLWKGDYIDVKNFLFLVNFDVKDKLVFVFIDIENK